MDDFKIIFYILLAVGYFIFNFFRKNFNADNTEPKKFRDENEPPVERPKPQQRPPVPVTSFEDILRELQPKMEKQVPQPVPIPVPAQEYRPQTIAQPKPKVSRFEYEKPVAISLEREFPKRKPLKKEEVFETYNTKPSTRLRSFDPAILRNPTTVRDAFILSEIFNRKY